MRESTRPSAPAPARFADVRDRPPGVRDRPPGVRDRPPDVRDRPLVERIAGWSAQHRAAAVFAWLGFLLATFIASPLVGGTSVPQYGPGQAGHAHKVLHRLHVTSPPWESDLLQARSRR